MVRVEWLVDIFLSYGAAGAAHYSAMPGLLRAVDFKVALFFKDDYNNYDEALNARCSPGCSTRAPDGCLLRWRDSGCTCAAD